MVLYFILYSHCVGQVTLPPGGYPNTAQSSQTDLMLLNAAIPGASNKTKMMIASHLAADMAHRWSAIVISSKKSDWDIPISKT